MRDEDPTFRARVRLSGWSARLQLRADFRDAGDWMLSLVHTQTILILLILPLSMADRFQTCLRVDVFLRFSF